MAGTLDTTFGTNGTGYTYSNFGGNSESASTNQVIDSNNCTIVTGYTVINKTSRLLLAKYTSSGILDTTFGGGKGYVIGDYYSGQDSFGTSLVLDNSGNIIIVGYTDVGDGQKVLLLTKYKSNGVLDTTFGGGKGWSYFGASEIGNSTLGNSLALDSSGRIVVTGNIYNDMPGESSNSFLLARFTPSGVLDTKFGGNGTGWTTNIKDLDAPIGTKVVIDKETGSIIILCRNVPYNYRAGIAKFTSYGKLDTSFGNGNGYIYTTDNSGYYGSSTFSNIIMDTSKYILFTSMDEYSKNILLVRYNSNDGSLDTNFGENTGYTIITIPNYKSNGSSIVIDSIGHIIVSGIVTNNATTEVKNLLVRYSKNGILDKTFGGGLGYSINTLGGVITLIISISLDNNDRIVVSGYGGIYSLKTELIIARYLNENNEPICLVSGTPILTDQGLVAIEKIDTAIHTIGKKLIVAITTTITPEKHLVCFEANSMGINCPTVRTVMTPGHEILYNGKLVQAKHFVGRVEGVHTVPYNGRDVLYNVLMEQHGLMRVNNMVLETLHPENKVAKQILGKI